MARCLLTVIALIALSARGMVAQFRHPAVSRPRGSGVRNELLFHHNLKGTSARTPYRRISPPYLTTRAADQAAAITSRERFAQRQTRPQPKVSTRGQRRIGQQPAAGYSSPHQMASFSNHSSGSFQARRGYGSPSYDPSGRALVPSLAPEGRGGYSYSTRSSYSKFNQRPTRPVRPAPPSRPARQGTNQDNCNYLLPPFVKKYYFT